VYRGDDTLRRSEEEGAMRSFGALAVLAASVVLTAAVSAQERSAPAGAVTVRPVQVREVRVNQPAPPPLHDQRPGFGVERPVDPGFISRPIPRPQPGVTAPRPVGRRHAGNRVYSFTPRYNIGAGVVVGYPIIYPYAYPYDPFTPSGSTASRVAPPSPNTYSNADSLATSSRVTAAPASGRVACEASAPCGGVSFDLTPATAQIYVDGIFAGLAEDFDATSAPLLLAPGTHYLEIRLAGFRTASVDATIAAGEVTPYQGSLERLRLRTP
jgi:hypothetical protein